MCFGGGAFLFFLFFLCGWGEGGAQFKAVSEMPRPYVTVVLQATEHCRFAKSSLTRRGDAPNKLLNLLEQLLHKIKANRRREIGSRQGHDTVRLYECVKKDKRSQ